LAVFVVLQLTAVADYCSYDHRKQGPNNSRQFAQYLAAVMLGQGFKVYLYEGFVATPLVPYAIEAKKCCGGVMVTASHNPKQVYTRAVMVRD
jgi:phosphomannomutase